MVSAAVPAVCIFGSRMRAKRTEDYRRKRGLCKAADSGIQGGARGRGGSEFRRNLCCHCNWYRPPAYDAQELWKYCGSSLWVHGGHIYQG